jgi:predicted RNA-binding Zn-ribbon protein involved in translation (DUF1610 family)
MIATRLTAVHNPTAYSYPQQRWPPLLSTWIMAIEFACSRCHKTIRVDASAAGKRGKCPQCGEIVTVPSAAERMSPATVTPLSTSGGPTKIPAQGNLSFPCPACGKSVTAPASASGKRGKCPHCQATVVIGGSRPESLSSSSKDLLEPAQSNTATRATHSGGDDPFADLPVLAALPALEAKVLPDGPPLNPLGYAPSPLGALPSKAGELNPYVSASQAEVALATAPLKLLIPAVLLFLVSLVSIGLNLYQAIGIVNHPERARQFFRLETQEQAKAVQLGYVVGGVGVAIVAIVINAGIMLAAIFMIRMRNWNYARIGAIAAIIPCCSLFCLNLPLGVWALIVLHQEDVRRQFN